MRKPNVLFINHSVRDGGPGKSLFYILKYLDRGKINPFVLIPRHDLFSENLKAEGIFENVITDSRFPENIQKSGTGPGSGPPGGRFARVSRIFSVLANIARMVRLVMGSSAVVKANAIDVIYCNGTLAKIIGAFMGKKNAKPVIWHVRNIQQAAFMKFLMRRLSEFECVKNIICVSNATASQFKNVKDKVNVVYNGVAPEDFDADSSSGSLRREFSIPRDTLIVGSTGRIVPRKGYMDFLEVARGVVSNPDLKGRVKFVVVGDTPHFFPEDHLAELKTRAGQLGVLDCFIFTGYRKDVRPCLADFDLFVVPSNYPDPFPRSVIEAMAAGLAVVGFSAGGIAEAVEDAKTGFLCPRDDFGKMRERIEELLSDAESRRRMGRAGRNRVIEMCSAADRTADIQEIILKTG